MWPLTTVQFEEIVKFRCDLLGAWLMVQVFRNGGYQLAMEFSNRLFLYTLVIITIVSFLSTEKILSNFDSKIFNNKMIVRFWKTKPSQFNFFVVKWQIKNHICWVTGRLYKSDFKKCDVRVILRFFSEVNNEELRPVITRCTIQIK